MSNTKRAPKRRKLVAATTDQNDMQVAGPSNRELASPPPPLPSIFKLTPDCCDEIFEYLSLEDLLSFGHTCKTFQKVAGVYFKRNYSATCFYMNYQGISIKSLLEHKIPPGFNQYVTKVDCTHPSGKKYFAQHADEFTSINGWRYYENVLKESKINQKLYSKIEYLQFSGGFDKNSVSNLSEICPNLKSLSMSLGNSESYNIRWLHEVYPNLTQLTLYRLPPIADLVIFFEQNPNVRSFSVYFADIRRNKDSLLSSTIKLDLLKLDIFHLPESFELLNQLYQRDFYKRLHLNLGVVNQYGSEQLLTLKGLEILIISGFDIKSHILPQLTQLKRLDIKNQYVKPDDAKHLANGLVKLERISIMIRYFNNMLPFIRNSINLNKMRVYKIQEEYKRDKIGKEMALNLSMLNKEREKLAGARKVTIYVEDDVYLSTKWATENGNTNLNLVEMRRISSFEWDIGGFYLGFQQ